MEICSCNTICVCVCVLPQMRVTSLESWRICGVCGRGDWLCHVGLSEAGKVACCTMSEWCWCVDFFSSDFLGSVPPSKNEDLLTSALVSSSVSWAEPAHSGDSALKSTYVILGYSALAWICSRWTENQRLKTHATCFPRGPCSLGIYKNTPGHMTGWE
jgi:hypothetical protein